MPLRTARQLYISADCSQVRKGAHHSATPTVAQAFEQAFEQACAGFFAGLTSMSASCDSGSLSMSGDGAARLGALAFGALAFGALASR